MSGPTTTIVFPGSVSVLLAAAAIEAFRAMRDAGKDAEALARQHAAEKEQRREVQEQALRQGEQARQGVVADAEARFAALIELARQLGIAGEVEAVRPASPTTSAPEEIAAYVAGLTALADRMGAVLLAEAARQKEKLAKLPTDLALPAARKGFVERQMERIAPLGAVPEVIGKLAREFEAAPPGERAELLANELRHAVQKLLEAAEREKVQTATAIVLEQTLKDLGYQVEEIPHTLFVSGGVVHFRRAGWGDYLVRLRADAKASTLNFNVIRAVEAGANERSALDHIAEDRWCAEFPALLKALEARGVGMEVTRRLGAGELPVQLVERGKLPAFTDEEQARPRAQLKAREIK